MGFENYDLIYEELESVMKKYGYHVSILYNNADDCGEETITAKFRKVSET